MPPPTDRISLTGTSLERLKQACREEGVPEWRAGQLANWVYQRDAASFDDVSDWPRPLREKWAAAWSFRSTAVAERHESTDGTIKFLIRLSDGETAETVLIPDTGFARRQLAKAAIADEPSYPGEAPDRWTVCFSTQVGCPIRCTFCASGLGGLKRQCSPGEIVEQVLHARAAAGRRPDGAWPGLNLVAMGMGEPLTNYRNLLDALAILHADWGLGIGLNRITVSTVGVPGKIEALSREPLAPNLACSLHAPTDELRSTIVPTTPACGVAEIVADAKAYRAATGREVTFEYVLIDGVNASRTCAERLAKRVAGSGCKVNLIPLNGVSEIGMNAPSDADVQAFRDVLTARGVTATIRFRKGADIAAACGQLRRRTRAESPRRNAPTSGAPNCHPEPCPPLRHTDGGQASGGQGEGSPAPE
ncbi:MAG: 23S rRNA (adenine(2503)-C(2))-methyltransferase RlmN [Planctomycetes bacterium]|nr:23S rRNA (adenine(2503)-C(2))-methyltransferase RlmN [Planctomycetota bacterium]